MMQSSKKNNKNIIIILCLIFVIHTFFIILGLEYYFFLKWFNFIFTNNTYVANQDIALTATYVMFFFVTSILIILLSISIQL